MKPNRRLFSILLLMSFGLESLLGPTLPQWLQSTPLAPVALAADAPVKTPENCAKDLEVAQAKTSTPPPAVAKPGAPSHATTTVESVLTLKHPLRTLGHIIPVLPFIKTMKNKDRKFFVFVEAPFITGVPGVMASVIFTKTFFWLGAVALLGSTKAPPELLSSDTAIKFLESWTLYNVVNIFRNGVTVDPTIPDNKAEWYKSEKFWLNYEYSALGYYLGIKAIKPLIVVLTTFLASVFPEHVQPAKVNLLDDAHKLGESINSVAWPIASQYAAIYFVTRIMFGQWPQKSMMDWIRKVDPQGSNSEAALQAQITKAEELIHALKERHDRLIAAEANLDVALEKDRSEWPKVLRDIAGALDEQLGRAATPEEVAENFEKQLKEIKKSLPASRNTAQQLNEELKSPKSYADKTKLLDAQIKKLEERIQKYESGIQAMNGREYEVSYTARSEHSQEQLDDRARWPQFAIEIAKDLEATDSKWSKAHRQERRDARNAAGWRGTLSRIGQKIVGKPSSKTFGFKEVMKRAQFDLMNSQNTLQEVKAQRRWLLFLTNDLKTQRGKDIPWYRWGGMYLHKAAAGASMAMIMNSLYWGLRIFIAGDMSTHTPTLLQRLEPVQVRAHQTFVREAEEAEKKFQILHDSAEKKLQEIDKFIDHKIDEASQSFDIRPDVQDYGAMMTPLSGDATFDEAQLKEAQDLLQHLMEHVSQSPEFQKLAEAAQRAQEHPGEQIEIDEQTAAYLEKLQALAAETPEN